MKPLLQRLSIIGVILGAILGAILFGIAPQAHAQNYPWCAQYSMGFGGAMNCGFVSFNQCMTTVQGMGGFCMENNTYVPPPGPHAPAARKYRGAKGIGAKNS